MEADKKFRDTDYLVNYKYKIERMIKPKVFHLQSTAQDRFVTNKKFIAELMFDEGDIVERNVKNLDDFGNFETNEMPRPAVQAHIGKPVYRIFHSRHPFARLRSAYTDKFCHWQAKSSNSNTSSHDKMFRNQYTNSLFKIYWDHAKVFETKKSLKRKPKNCATSFYAYLQFIINGQGLGKLSNQHWESMVEVCGACIGDYNIFTHLESIDEDVEFLEKLFGLERLGKFPSWRVSSGSGKDEKKKTMLDIEEELKTHYSVLDKTDMLKLYKIYEYDFRLFGYDPEPFLSL